MKTGTQKSVGRRALIGVWALLLALGACAVSIDPLLAAPWAPQAKQAIAALLFTGAVQDLGIAAYYVTIVLFSPLLIYAVLVIIEARLGDERAPGLRFEQAWVVQALFIMATAAMVSAINRLDLRPAPLIEWERQPGSIVDWLKLAALYLCILIVSDLLTYWVHRAQHRFGWLWKFHAVHHSQELSALRNINHPVDTITSYLLVVIPAGLIVRISGTEIIVLACFFVLQSQLNHMRAPLHLGPLGALLVDNRYHFIHHSVDPAEYNSNFAGRFPFIDMLFGTYRGRSDELCETGLGDRDPPSNLLNYVLAVCPEREHERTETTRGRDDREGNPQHAQLLPS